MDNLSIFYEWNCIEINFIVHAKFDIFPILFCKSRKKCIKIIILDTVPLTSKSTTRTMFNYAHLLAEIRGKPVIDGRVALFPRTFKCRLDFNSPPSMIWHLTVSAVFDLTFSDIIPPTSKITMQNIKFNQHTCHFLIAYRSKFIKEFM